MENRFFRIFQFFFKIFQFFHCKNVPWAETKTTKKRQLKSDHPFPSYERSYVCQLFFIYIKKKTSGPGELRPAQN